MELARAYAALLNARVTLLIPSRGSVGAADLTALAEVAAVVTGEGRVLPDAFASDALAAAGLTPVELAHHEALAAISGNAYSVGVGVGALLVADVEAVAVAADRAAALSLEAVSGNLSPYSEIIADARGASGQRASAVAACGRWTPAQVPGRSSAAVSSCPNWSRPRRSRPGSPGSRARCPPASG
ncbi:hypothetical protein ATY41_01440 [Leifsonia xyli subsp. xyli]|uniref:Uncharacterized protein n=1 Tax=Leifsonia xyli subsp. xyli TaxID=59736 RepID=A0A1E2SNP1_LEIXY|nr:hypothetical protein ATY41_01440 [Leifsonia xyli subsp. xyli]